MGLLDDLIKNEATPTGKPAAETPSTPAVSTPSNAEAVKQLLKGVAELGTTPLNVPNNQPATDPTSPGFSLGKEVSGAMNSTMSRPKTLISEGETAQAVSVDDVNSVAKRISSIEQNLIYSESSSYNIPNPTDCPPGRPYK